MTESTKIHRRLDTVPSFSRILSQVYSNRGAPETPTAPTIERDIKRKSHRRSRPIISCQELFRDLSLINQETREEPPLPPRPRGNSSASSSGQQHRRRPSRAIRSPRYTSDSIPSPLVPLTRMEESNISPHVDKKTSLLLDKVDMFGRSTAARHALDMPRLEHFSTRKTKEVTRGVMKRLKSAKRKLSQATAMEMPCHLLATPSPSYELSE